MISPDIAKPDHLVPLEVNIEEIRQIALDNNFKILSEKKIKRFLRVELVPKIIVSFWALDTRGREITMALPSHANLFAEAVNNSE